MPLNDKITIKEYKELLKSDRINIGSDVKDNQNYSYKPYRNLRNYLQWIIINLQILMLQIVS